MRKVCYRSTFDWIVWLLKNLKTVWVTVLHQVCFDNTLFLSSFPTWYEWLGTRLRWPRVDVSVARSRSSILLSCYTPEQLELSRMWTTHFFYRARWARMRVFPSGIWVMFQLWIASWLLRLDWEINLAFARFTPPQMERAWSFFRFIGKLKFISWAYLILSFSIHQLYFFEIYPQSKIPLLTQIAHFRRFSCNEAPAHLLPDILICRNFDFLEKWNCFQSCGLPK